MPIHARSLTLCTLLVALAGCGATTPATPEEVAPALRAQAIAGPTELLVKLRVTASPRAVETLESRYGLREKEVIAAIDVHVMTIVTGEEAEALARRVAASTLVAYAEPNHRLTIQ